MSDDSKDLPNSVDLQTRWDAEYCPIVEGVVFANGRVKTIVVEWGDGGDGQIELSLKPHGWTSLSELKSAGRLEWTNVGWTREAIDTDRNLRVVCGEGGYGGDGFVAALYADSGQLKWIAFFSRSNPFEQVDLVGDAIVATNNLGTRWRFPLNSPENVVIE